MHSANFIPARDRLDVAISSDAISYADPLDADIEGDLPILVTRRQLIRLATVSTAVGARFERDAIDHESKAWMLAPRDLFGGRAAIDAVLERRHCMRALVLHGLGLGMDARQPTSTTC